MASAASSSSSSLGSTQSPSMASVPAFQMLNHTLPVKLDRTNYVLWRSQMDNVVFANGFENFIEGISICPQKETSDGLVNPDFVIIGHTTSYSAWIALEKIFSSSSRARKGSMSMIDYLMKIKCASDSLAAIGEPVSEQDQIMNLLGGLGADYNAMVTAINTRDDKISLEAVHSMLLSFEHRLEQQNSVEDASNMTANLASSNNRDDAWYLDSGASHHLTPAAGNLNNTTPYTGTERVTVGNGKKLSISSIDCNLPCSSNKTTVCSSCQLAKSHRLPLKLSSSHVSNPLELVYTDIWGPAPIKSTSGARYFILFVDDFSRFTWFYSLQTKDQALSVFKQFKILVENQFNTTIKCLQSDNGGEFRSFLPFLNQSGIIHRFSCPYTSSQNGRVERKHRHVVETGLALLAHASLPLIYW
ncbi:hypothetical protein UlMin_026873 [Ulmus minor]